MTDMTNGDDGSAARDLRPGDKLAHGDWSWEVLATVEVDPAPLGLPYVRLRCLDHRREIREFTLPCDFPVTGDIAARSGGDTQSG